MKLQNPLERNSELCQTWQNFGYNQKSLYSFRPILEVYFKNHLGIQCNSLFNIVAIVKKIYRNIYIYIYICMHRRGIYRYYYWLMFLHTQKYAKKYTKKKIYEKIYIWPWIPTTHPPPNRPGFQCIRVVTPTALDEELKTFRTLSGDSKLSKEKTEKCVPNVPAGSVAGEPVNGYLAFLSWLESQSSPS